MNRFKQYLIACCQCGANTSKQYAREHEGKCKTCHTGIEQPYKGPTCSQCGGPISAYKSVHHYVCDGCTKQNDPMGWANEVRGFND